MVLLIVAALSDDEILLGEVATPKTSEQKPMTTQFPLHTRPNPGLGLVWRRNWVVTVVRTLIAWGVRVKIIPLSVVQCASQLEIVSFKVGS